MSSEGVEFRVNEMWHIEEPGEYVIDYSCDGCEDTSWVTSVDQMEERFLESPLIFLGCGLCLFGFVATVGAIAVGVSGKPKTQVIMVGADGQRVALSNLTPEQVMEMKEDLEAKQIIAQNKSYVAPPFADTGLQQQQSQEFKDATESVQRGEMMTTDQVYSLMQGDVAGAMKNHPLVGGNEQLSPSEKLAAQQREENAKQISFWDEGFQSDEVKPVQTKAVRPKVKPLDSSSLKQDDSNWKEWDEA